ncbi:hypothetical protein FM114_07285 [Luteococcus japonicus LSP_Lj1]|uniref:Uncharacterized protein n=1 Tax=Luteococcus japonicus LSP_Lj1 TaxID=1255658 RepID=A0A1R4JFU3_9ACTN|nr:hypothetical protein FM114_07285 [Luteococcus japonicus LSP_Lj1]
MVQPIVRRCDQCHTGVIAGRPLTASPLQPRARTPSAPKGPRPHRRLTIRTWGTRSTCSNMRIRPLGCGW